MAGYNPAIFSTLGGGLDVIAAGARPGTFAVRAWLRWAIHRSIACWPSPPSRSTQIDRQKSA